MGDKGEFVLWWDTSYPHERSRLTMDKILVLSY